jgi:hypothetical protein
MASNIISNTIDENFPVAGQDNDSQGFRNNNAIIKSGLATAGTEITDLQNNTAKTNTDSNFAGNEIVDATLASAAEKYYEGGTVTSGQEINFNNGLYQSFTLSNDVAFTLSNFPDNARLGRMQVELRSNSLGTPRVAAFAYSGGTIKPDDSSAWSGTTISMSHDENPIIIEFWTYDEGLTVFAKYLGQFS